MSIVTDTRDQIPYYAPEIGDESKRLAISYLGSIAINALFLALMIVGLNIYAPLRLTERPIEVTIEASTKLDAQTVRSESAPVRRPSASQLPPAADLSAQLPQAFDPREIADEERQRRAALDRVIAEGNGTDKSRTAAPRSKSNENGDGEDAKNDPDKEAIRLVPPRPKDSDPRQKTRIAPPGQDSKPSAKQEPKEEDNETTAKRQQIQCGASAKISTWNSPQPAWGQVLGQLTKDQADRLIQITQANRDMFISPDYVDNIRVFIHVDGTPEGARAVALLPHGLTAQVGNRVEFVPGHLDPSRPCHYIPNLVSSVL